MKILLVADDELNIKLSLEYFEKHWEKKGLMNFQKKDIEVYPLITGHSPVFLTYALSNYPAVEQMDKIIYAGLAIATNRITEIGETVNVGRDIFGDVGIEESDGSFNDLFDLNLLDSAKFPFFKGEIFNEHIINPTKLRVVKSVSVNKIPGTWDSIEELTKKYRTDVLSVNGAALAYWSHMMDKKYLQIRTVYRYLEPTTIPNREREYAVKELNTSLLKLIDQIEFDKENPGILRVI